MADLSPTSDTAGSARQRPLSPHLQVYKPLFTMMMSILHRITGSALYVGMLLVAWWLIAAASGPVYFDWVNGIFGSFLGRLFLFGFTWALLHHMLGGVRHLVWDTITWLEVPKAQLLAKMTLGGSLGLTLLTWIVGYAVR
ncbi:MAG: succinate dehydrogenase, cytochrome b556 subunit [Pseudomonadota bacterium]